MNTFKPWVGNKYWSDGLKGVRVLILGESHYGDEGTHNPDFTKEVVKEWGQEKRNRFFTVVQKLVLGQGAGPVSDEQRSDFWEHVAFYNFVQSLVGTGPRERPTQEMWAAAKAPFLSTVSELKPQVLVVLGFELADNLPVLPSEVRVCTVQHPSSNGFSYEQWQPEILAALRSFAQPPLSPFILALARWVKREAVSEEALERMQQFGFVFPNQAGQLELTPYGEQTLRENGLA